MLLDKCCVCLTPRWGHVHPFVLPCARFCWLLLLRRTNP